MSTEQTYKIGLKKKKTQNGKQLQKRSTAPGAEAGVRIWICLIQSFTFLLTRRGTLVQKLLLFFV
jgi:hypothetical protein